jgi:hypothetical protein
MWNIDQRVKIVLNFNINFFLEVKNYIKPQSSSIGGLAC